MNWVIVVAGACLSLWEALQLWRGWSSRNWPAAGGEIVSARVREHRGRRTGYAPEVRYRYTVGAVALTGDRMSFGTTLLRFSESAVYAELQGVEPGTVVTVHYNPRKPSDAVLRPGASMPDVGMLVVGVILCVAGLQL